MILQNASNNLTLLTLFMLLLVAVQGIVPTTPIKASPNTELSPANFIFNLKLDFDLATSSYLLIVIPIFSTLITPKSCTMLSSSFIATSCINLDTASSTDPNPLTINSTWIQSLNPNVEVTTTIIVGFDNVLVANTEYSIQILLTSNLPAIGALSQSFQLYAMSGTGVMLQENWNFGQVFLETFNNNQLGLTSINSQASNLPGQTLSTLELDITIGVNCPTYLSRIMFTISNNFEFTLSSLVESIAVTGSAPQISTIEVISQNIIVVVYNQQFVVGRQFRAKITNIFNPLLISSGSVSIYTLPYNSISPLEVREQFVPFQTVSYTASITILTAEKLSPSAPIEFYSDTIQYITVNIQLPRNFDPDFVLVVQSDAAYIHEGTVFAKTSTVNVNTLVYTLLTQQSVQISGFPTIPSGSIITVTMKAWIGTTPNFNIIAKIDKAENIADPIIKGQTIETVSAIPDEFVTLLTGNGGQTNTLTAMTTASSSISFSVNPSFTTYIGSFLQIYTSVNLVTDTGFDTATSCMIGGSAQPCTIATSSDYTLITIASNTSYNLFPQSTTTTVVINDLKFNKASSHSSTLYHFYFQLTVSQAINPVVKKYLAVPFVVSQRQQLSSFGIYFSNNIYNSGSNFLSLVRIVSADHTDFTNIIQVNEKRIVSIFAYQGWTNYFTTLSSGDSYLCGCNLASTTFTYVKGSSYNQTTEQPLSWDRIDIILPGEQSTTKFSVVIPNTYTTTSDVLFEVMVGLINTNDGSVTYLNNLDKPTGAASTLLTPVNVAVYSKPQQASMQLNIAGQAGSYKNSISFTVSPSGSFSGTTYSTCLIVISSWEFFDSLSALSNISNSSADPLFANVEQMPMSLQVSTGSFLTYIPFKTVGAYTSDFDIVFDNIKMPYSLDLPYYSVQLIDQTGSLDGYNEFINQDQGIFYTGVLKSLQMNCNDNSLGVSNTFCTLTFVPFQQIEVSSVIAVTFTGMSVSTTLCTLTYSSTPIDISCSSDNNLVILTVKLNNVARLPALGTYELVVNGISINSSAINNYVNFQIKDPTGSYAIESRTRILLTSVQQNFPITISQVKFEYDNPVVASSLFINFTLPRTLNMDQAFSLIWSKDFANLNTIPAKMRMRLLLNQTQIEVKWVLKSINNQIVFEGLQSDLTAAIYSLQMYGIQTPSTITQDMIGIIYLRISDNTYTKTNVEDSTAAFPSLSSQINSLITFTSFFNTQGLQQEMQFTVVNQYDEVNEDSIWIVNFPRYYSQKLWNQDYLMHCHINDVPINCQRSMHTPYQIKISGSPAIISIGSTYSISIFGIVCPRASYLNGNAQFVTQNIFFGMVSSSSATSYSEYSQLFLSSSIVNPQTESGYGSVIIKNLTSSDMKVFQSAFFTIVATCSIDIVPGHNILLTFPQEFNNFNSIGFSIQTELTSFNFQISNNSKTVNTRASFTINTLTIPYDTEFKIVITNLLNPSTPATVDMNQLQMVVAASDNLTTVAASSRLRNQLDSMTFIENDLHLVINNYEAIQLTAGTYSTAIKIIPSDNTTFSGNMKITFSSTQLVFESNPTFMQLGKQQATFTIGASTNLVPTIYTFTLTKKQSALSQAYSTLKGYAVQVNSIPIPITIPSSFDVPLGGCSLPVQIILSNPPFSGVQIDLQYDSDTITVDKFTVNQEISYESLIFDKNTVSRWMSFCSDSTMTNTSFTIDLHLNGDNAKSYSLTNNQTTINFIAATGLNMTPSFTLTVLNAQKTYANIKFVTNQPGLFFYHLKLSPFNTPFDFDTLKSEYKAGNTTIQSQNDYLTSGIYSIDRDERIGYTNSMSAGDNFFNLDDLLPERTYTICGYFESQFQQVSDVQCVDFTMQAWGTTSKASISFSSAIQANELNSLLCFFARASGSEIDQIVDLEGNSCSLNTSPQNYFYKYSGNTTSSQLSQTIIYHIGHTNLTSDASISAFDSLYNSTDLTAASYSLATLTFSINFIQTSVALTSFNPIDVIDLSSGYKPSVSLKINDYTVSSYKISISSITANMPSSVYFVLVSHKNITKNQITSESSISIKPLVTPSSDQVASCLDGYGKAAVQCHRASILAGQYYSFDFTSITENSVYAIYYVIANQYPLRPIFYGGVKSKNVNTLNFGSYIGLWVLSILLIFML